MLIWVLNSYQNHGTEEGSELKHTPGRKNVIENYNENPNDGTASKLAGSETVIFGLRLILRLGMWSLGTGSADL